MLILVTSQGSIRHHDLQIPPLGVILFPRSYEVVIPVGGFHFLFSFLSPTIFLVPQLETQESKVEIQSWCETIGIRVSILLKFLLDILQYLLKIFSWSRERRIGGGKDENQGYLMGGMEGDPCYALH